MLAVLSYVYSSEQSVERIEDIVSLKFAGRRIHSSDSDIKMIECHQEKNGWVCQDEKERRVREFDIHCDDYVPGFIFTDSCVITITEFKKRHEEQMIFRHGSEYTLPTENYAHEDRKLRRILLQEVAFLHFDADLFITLRNGSVVQQMICNGSCTVQQQNLDCTNGGVVDGEVEWECRTYNLPHNMELKSAVVECDGWDGENDPFVVEESCYVVYEVGPM